MHRSGKLFGLALTVRTTPGDNLLVQKAVDLARPGEVIVIDGGGSAARALVGGNICRRAARRGVGGFVVDGAIRDLDVISTSDLPVYARYVTPRGPTREGHGAINVPLKIDGVVVRPGDVILGDLDGLVCVPRAEAAALIPKARHLAVQDVATLDQV